MRQPDEMANETIGGCEKPSSAPAPAQPVADGARGFGDEGATEALVRRAQGVELEIRELVEALRAEAASREAAVLRAKAEGEAQAAERHAMDLARAKTEAAQLMASEVSKAYWDAEQKLAAELARSRAEADARHSVELAGVQAEAQSSLDAAAKALAEAADAHQHETARVRAEAEALATAARDALTEAHDRHAAEMGTLRQEADRAISSATMQAARAKADADELVRSAHEALLKETQERDAEIERLRTELQTIRHRHALELDQLQSDSQAARRAAEAKLLEASEAHAAEIVALRHETAKASETYAAEAARLRAEANQLREQDAHRADVVAPHEARGNAGLGTRWLLQVQRRLGAAATLGDALQVLADGLAQDSARAAIVIVNDRAARIEQLRGFDKAGEPSPIELSPDGLIGQALELGEPCFARGTEGRASGLACAPLARDRIALAIPLAVGGRSVGAVYVDRIASSHVADETWRDFVEASVAYAGRALEALTAVLTSQALVDPPIVLAKCGPADSEQSGDASRPQAGTPGPVAAAEQSDAWDLTNLDGLAASEPDPLDAAPADRRRSARVAAGDMPLLEAVKLLPGHEVSLVDLSDGGALVETGSRLVPDTAVVLQFIGPNIQSRVRGRVLRCGVFKLDPVHGVKYRGAVAFTQTLGQLFHTLCQTESRASATTTTPVTGDAGEEMRQLRQAMGE